MSVLAHCSYYRLLTLHHIVPVLSFAGTIQSENCKLRPLCCEATSQRAMPIAAKITLVLSVVSRAMIVRVAPPSGR